MWLNGRSWEGGEHREGDCYFSRNRANNFSLSSCPCSLAGSQNQKSVHKRTFIMFNNYVAFKKLRIQLA